MDGWMDRCFEWNNFCSRCSFLPSFARYSSRAWLFTRHDERLIRFPFNSWRSFDRGWEGIVRPIHRSSANFSRGRFGGKFAHAPACVCRTCGIRGSDEDRSGTTMISRRRWRIWNKQLSSELNDSCLTFDEAEGTR